VPPSWYLIRAFFTTFFFFGYEYSISTQLNQVGFLPGGMRSGVKGINDDVRMTFAKAAVGLDDELFLLHVPHCISYFSCFIHFGSLKLILRMPFLSFLPLY
jgi:hypothetical protein